MSIKVTNLKDLGAAYNKLHRGKKPVERKTPAAPAPRKCFKCGGEMKHIPGTNIFTCNGEHMFKNPKTGKEEPCFAFALSKV